jgi:chromosome segregation ATPase
MTDDKTPSAEAIKMLREIHEEYQNDDSARGFISSKAAMALVEAYEALTAQRDKLEEEKKRLRQTYQNCVDVMEANDREIERLRNAAQELRKDMQSLSRFPRDKNISTFAKEAIARFDSAVLEKCPHLHQVSVSYRCCDTVECSDCSETLSRIDHEQ